MGLEEIRLGGDGFRKLGPRGFLVTGCKERFAFLQLFVSRLLELSDVLGGGRLVFGLEPEFKEIVGRADPDLEWAFLRLESFGFDEEVVAASGVQDEGLKFAVLVGRDDLFVGRNFGRGDGDGRGGNRCSLRGPSRGLRLWPGCRREPLQRSPAGRRTATQVMR